MPYAPETRRYDRSGTSRIAAHEQMLDLFTFAPLYQLGTVIDSAFEQARKSGSGRGRGRRSAFPATLQFGLLVAARAYSSVPEVIRALAIESTWQQVRDRYAAATGQHLPLRPPNRDQLDHFKHRLSDDDVLAQLQDMFRRCAIAQARDHGNLLAGSVCDWTTPFGANSIEGDGTTVKPFSKVVNVPDPFNPGELTPIGSRRKDDNKPRVQEIHSDSTEDGKGTRGVNMVSVHTWTPWGRVVLGTATALRAEQWAALELIEAVAARAGDGLHTVIWDKAVTGWQIDYLMAAHRIQVLGKSVAQGEREATTDIEDEHEAGETATSYALLSQKQRDAKARRLSRKQARTRVTDVEGRSHFALTEAYLQQRAERLAAELQLPATRLVVRTLRQDELASMFIKKRPTPVGTSIYKTSSGFEPVHGKTYYLNPVSHDTPGGPCTHELVIDDGSLYLVGVDPYEEHPVKEARLPCQTSTPRRGDTGRWARVNTYTVPCPNGAFTYTHTWTPQDHRGTPDSPKPKRIDPSGSELRPLARADEAFNEYYSRRNDTESYNAWYKRTLPIRGRAASIDRQGQELDFLTAAVLNNSITMSRRDRG